MELDYVALADFALQRPDGKLDIHGVGWDTIAAPAVPVTHPRMDLAVRFLLSGPELEAEHKVVVTLTTADGATLMRMEANVVPPPDAQLPQLPLDRRVAIGLVLSLNMVTFPDYGTYQIAVFWDGNELRAIRLFVAPPPPPALP
jgi:hypothetical protein